jgi:hypothetical protein
VTLEEESEEPQKSRPVSDFVGEAIGEFGSELTYRGIAAGIRRLGRDEPSSPAEPRIEPAGDVDLANVADGVADASSNMFAEFVGGIFDGV